MKKNVQVFVVVLVSERAQTVDDFLLLNFGEISAKYCEKLGKTGKVQIE